MNTFIYNDDRFFGFSDTPITKCFLSNKYLHIETKFVYCSLNNNNKTAIYSSEGHPKLNIQLEKIKNWTNWITQEEYIDGFEQHFSELVGVELIAFSLKNNIGKIIYDFGEIEFEFIDLQIIVSPENLYFYRDFDKEEVQKFSSLELPKTNLPVSFH